VPFTASASSRTGKRVESRDAAGAMRMGWSGRVGEIAP
jgi:hypothetical protein